MPQTSHHNIPKEDWTELNVLLGNNARVCNSGNSILIWVYAASKPDADSNDGNRINEDKTFDYVSNLDKVYIRSISTNGLISGTPGIAVGSLDGALNIHNADVHNIPINTPFFRIEGGSSTLAVAASKGDTSIEIISATGFAQGDEIRVDGFTSQTTFPTISLAPVGNVLTLDRPLDNDHAIGVAIDEVSSEMNGIGTLAASVVNYIQPPAGVIWHITRIITTMTHSTAGDLGLFGNLPALANGVVFRANVSGQIGTFSNWKSNADIKSDMYDVEFDTRSGGGGTFGTSGRGSFNRIGVAVRLDGSLGDRLEILVQDDLSTLTSFEIKAQGHIEGAP